MTSSEAITSLNESSIEYVKNTLNDQQHTSSSPSETEEKENLEAVRRRKTSIDALDLQTVNQATQAKRKVSQIDNLRHKFQEYHRKPSNVTAVDESNISGSGEGPKRRKVSQIDRFRSKFLAYAQNGAKGETLGALKEGDHSSGNTNRRSPPSHVSSDGEDLPRFSSSPPTYLHDDNNNNNNNSNSNNFVNLSQQNDNSELKQNDTARKRSHPPRLSLANVLQSSKLVTVTLNREQGEGWGIELVHVTKTGSSMSQNDNSSKEEEKVVYVLHNGNGQNSIVNTSTTIDSMGDLFAPSETSTPHSPDSSGSSEHEITSILGTSRSSVNMDKPGDDMRHVVHKQNLRRRMGVTQPSGLVPSDASPILSRPGSAPHMGQINPLPQRPSSAFSQWSKEGSPPPRPGVRIVALTEEGVAATSGELAVDDLIVEVSKVNLIHGK